MQANRRFPIDTTYYITPVTPFRRRAGYPGAMTTDATPPTTDPDTISRAEAVGAAVAMRQGRFPVYLQTDGQLTSPKASASAWQALADEAARVLSERLGRPLAPADTELVNALTTLAIADQLVGQPKRGDFALTFESVAADLMASLDYWVSQEARLVRLPAPGPDTRPN